ncbi:hypothetical protein [Burkholderia sp. LMG 13014]|uniref:hypothetical protein n=1 Tax=Burkholderia sp. LMG 13014 TaxID=2709306 RepID=UPI0019650B23|nr:hypothetical protein [Burkholderia sp. LMG 13014]
MANSNPSFSPSMRAVRSKAPRIFQLILPVVATSTSAVISVIAGIERGGTLSERVVWASLGVAMLLCAHLILAFARGQSVAIRIPAAALWLCSTLGTGYGHATFFLEAQQHAGEIRAASIAKPAVIIPDGHVSRDPAEVAARRAKLEGRLAVLKARKCKADCAMLGVERERTVAQLKALDVELAEAQRNEQLVDADRALHDRALKRQDALRDDPVTARIAQLFGCDVQAVNLAIALGMGWLLEGMACVGWLLVLAPRAEETPQLDRAQVAHQISISAPVVAPVESVESSHPEAFVKPVAERDMEESAGSSETVAGGISSPVDDAAVAAVNADDLSRLAAGVENGEIKATVSDIRRFFACSQAKALVLRRAFWQSMQDMPMSAVG